MKILVVEDDVRHREEAKSFFLSVDGVEVVFAGSFRSAIDVVFGLEARMRLRANEDDNGYLYEWSEWVEEGY